MDCAPTTGARHADPAGARLEVSRGRWRLALAGLTVYALCLHVPYLGAWPLGAHEALAAQRAREMTAAGGWLVPELGGVPDYRKPPLPFWISGALAAVAGGMDEWTARLPSVAASIGVTLLVAFWARRLAGWRAGLAAGLAFATCGAALAWSRRAEVDMQLCFWTTAALVAYWFAREETRRRWQVALAAAMWLALAAGVLTKGPLPLAMVALGAGAAIVVDPARRRNLRLLPVLGPLLFLAALAPWVVAVLLRRPEAASLWYEQSLGRYGGTLGHEKPAYFYAVEAPLLWMPWVVPLAMGVVAAVRGRAMARRDWALLLAWGVGGLVMLSFGTGKRLQYALPAVPPMMVFAGIGLARLLEAPRPLPRTWRRALWLHAGLVPAAVAGGIVAAVYMPDYRPALVVLGVIASAGLAAALLLYARARPVAALGAVAATLLATMLTANGALVGPIVTRSSTEAAIGRTVASLPAEAPLAAYKEADAQVLFYADRPMPVLRNLDEAIAWRRDRPDGYLVSDRGRRAELDRAGAWDVVLPAPGGDPLAGRDIFLLRPAGSAVAGLAPLRKQDR